MERLQARHQEEVARWRGERGEGEEVRELLRLREQVERGQA